LDYLEDRKRRTGEEEGSSPVAVIRGREGGKGGRRGRLTRVSPKRRVKGDVVTCVNAGIPKKGKKIKHAPLCDERRRKKAPLPVTGRSLCRRRDRALI